MAKMTLRDQYELLTKERLEKFLPQEKINEIFNKYPIVTGIKSNEIDYYGYKTKSEVLILYRTKGGWVTCSTKKCIICPAGLRPTKYISNYCIKTDNEKLDFYLEHLKKIWQKKEVNNNNNNNNNNNIDISTNKTNQNIFNNITLEYKIKTYFKNQDVNTILELMGEQGQQEFLEWWNSNNKNLTSQSFGEFLTEKALFELKIPFIKEFSIKDLEGKFLWKKCPRFDFLIYKNNNPIGVIEYDGAYHSPDNFFINFRDVIKNMYANLNYPLGILRIPKECLNSENIKNIIKQNYGNIGE